MKICNDCNVEMIECNNPMIRTNLHVSGVDDARPFIKYLNYDTEELLTPWDFVKARTCPKCGKLELYVDPIKTKLNEVKKNK